MHAKKGSGSFDIFDLSKDADNRFDHLLSKKALAVMKRVGAYGIGITVNEDGKLIPAGTLVFSADDPGDIQDMPFAINLHWLYVDERFRRIGAGTRLMEIFAEIVNDSKADCLICDTPLDPAYDVLIRMLEDWGFVFGLTEKNEYILTWDDIADHELLKHPGDLKNVRSLMDIPEEMLSNVLHDLHLEEYEGFIWQETDLTLSCIYMHDEAPEGILLVRRNPEYMIEPVLIRTGDDTQNAAKVQRQLLGYAIKNLDKKTRKDIFFYIQLRSLTGAKLWDDLFPDIGPSTVRRGVFMLEEDE